MLVSPGGRRRGDRIDTPGAPCEPLSLSPFSLLGTSLSSGFIKTSNYNLIINLSPLQVPSKRPNENHSSAIFPSFDPEYRIDLYSSFLRFVRLRKKKRKKGITFSTFLFQFLISFLSPSFALVSSYLIRASTG